MSAAVANRDLSSQTMDLCEGQICGDVANIAIDLTGAFQKSALTASAMTVFGRTLAVASNFLPHHTAHPEQLLCQSILLLAAVHGLVKNVDKETSTSAPASLREGRAFKSFFGPAGLTWSQFKSVSASAIDWVTYENGEVVASEDDSDFLYWLYAGEVDIESSSSTVTTTVSRSSAVPRHSDSAKPCKMGIWGDVKFSRMLRGQDASFVPKSSLRAGAGGATMVRIHAPTLKKMMAEDSALATSMESVLFKSVHNKAIENF